MMIMWLWPDANSLHIRRKNIVEIDVITRILTPFSRHCLVFLPDRHGLAPLMGTGWMSFIVVAETSLSRLEWDWNNLRIIVELFAFTPSFVPFVDFSHPQRNVGTEQETLKGGDREEPCEIKLKRKIMILSSQ